MSYKFEMPSSDNKAIIKVIGVGGGGGNAVNYMYQNGIQDVEFVVCNTDAQALKISPIPRKLVLGLQITEGLGAGTNPEIGMKAAMEDKEKIRELLVDTKMVFVTAGMGGGTGTGAAPVIARIAKEMDILTVGVVTLPFSFEGKKKLMLAEEGILQMKEHCDTVIVILNDKIREMHGNLNLKEAFSQSDVILTTAAKSIAEIITRPGFINVDFNDIHMVMSKAGAAVMGSAVASGTDRALKAAESAIHSPLLNNTDITGANKILVSITCSESNFSMDEFGVINEYFQDTAGQDALLKCGVNYDDSIGDEIRVTVIATGFAEVNQKATNYTSKSNLQINAGRQTSIFDPSKNEPPKVEQKVVGKEPQIQDEQVILQASKGVFTTADERSKLILNLDGPDYETQKSEQIPSVKKSVDLQDMDTDKKKKASQDYIIRTTKISQATLFGSMSNEEHQDRFNIPAYIRRGEKLTEVPHSSERIVSRYNLNDKNELLGNNTFLHDNVD